MRKIILGSLGAGAIFTLSVSQMFAFGGGMMVRRGGMVIRPFMFPWGVRHAVVRHDEEVDEETSSEHVEFEIRREHHDRRVEFRSSCSDGDVDVSISHQDDGSTTTVSENSSCWVRVSHLSGN